MKLTPEEEAKHKELAEAIRELPPTLFTRIAYMMLDDPVIGECNDLRNEISTLKSIIRSVIVHGLSIEDLKDELRSKNISGI